MAKRTVVVVPAKAKRAKRAKSRANQAAAAAVATVAAVTAVVAGKKSIELVWNKFAEKKARRPFRMTRFTFKAVRFRFAGLFDH